MTRERRRARGASASSDLADELQTADWYTTTGWTSALDQVAARASTGPATAGASSTAPRWTSARARTASSAIPRAPGTSSRPSGCAAEAEAQIELLTAEPGRHPVRLLQLPLLRQRGLPARLQLPAAAAVGLHPRPAGQADDRTSSCRGPASWPSPSSGRAASSTTRAPATSSTG